jgi:lysozyme family protein
MSDFATCLAWTLHNEDSQLTYEATPDIGGFAIAGINSHVWPASYAYIAGLPVTERAAAVSTFYRCKFWAPAMAKIVSNEVAKRLFDCAVNEGFETAVCIFQRAIADLSGIIDEDGKLGKGTVDRANLLDPDKLVRAFQNERVTAYEKIVAEHPEKKDCLAGWLARARL